MRGTIAVFFRSITVKNRDRIPKKGPLIILANHPSTFMDPIVIASLINRKVYFLGKGELFKTAFAKWLLPKLNIIPVYRKQDDPSLMSRNADTFKKCFEHLENGGAILIFPEGISITERKLNPIKTGAARIALGAEYRNHFKLGVQIINIGLNYADPHRFNRDLFVNIEKPIEVISYSDKYKLDEFKASSELTEEIRKQLETLTISIQDEKMDKLVKDVETLYKYELQKARGVVGKDVETEFSITQNIIKSVHYFSETKPEFVEDIQQKIENYFEGLKELNIDDGHISRNRSNKSFVWTNVKSFLFLLLGFPIYLYGLINNYLPFEIPGWVAPKLAKSNFRGAIGMVVGAFCFLLFYPFQIFFVHHFFHKLSITFVYTLTLPLSGIFTYYYWHKFNKIKAKWILLSLFFTRSRAVASLIAERESIIAEFEKAKQDFLQKFPDTILTK